MLFSLSCTAQKAFKPVKTALKDKKYNEAITQIEKLRTDSTFKNNTKLCLYAIEAYRGLNDAENTKIYLKKTTTLWLSSQQPGSWLQHHYNWIL